MRLLLPCRCRRAQRSRRRGDAKKKAEGVQAMSATLGPVKAGLGKVGGAEEGTTKTAGDGLEDRPGHDGEEQQ